MILVLETQAFYKSFIHALIKKMFVTIHNLSTNLPVYLTQEESLRSHVSVYVYVSLSVCVCMYIPQKEGRGSNLRLNNL